jgi:hypothetical protein
MFNYVDWLFTLLVVSFGEQKLFYLVQYHLWILALISRFIKSLPKSVSWSVFYVFFQRFQSLRSMLHFWVDIWVDKRLAFSLLLEDFQFSLHHLSKRSFSQYAVLVLFQIRRKHLVAFFSSFLRDFIMKEVGFLSQTFSAFIFCIYVILVLAPLHLWICICSTILEFLKGKQLDMIYDYFNVILSSVWKYFIEDFCIQVH